MLPKFKKIKLDNLVDFEKCCKTRIFLQKSVPIQPKTSNILPNFCRSAVVSPTGALAAERAAAAGGYVVALAASGQVVRARGEEFAAVFFLTSTLTVG